jgi:predicted RND superfamily exporter protein
VLAAGFSILTLSEFQPNRVLGLLMVVTVTAGLAGDLVLLPALLVPLPRRRAPWTFRRKRGALPVKA